MDVVRDAFGFEVKRDLHSLYLKAEKLLLREERERSDRWNSFLRSLETTASDSSAATPGSRSLTVLADLLEQCLIQQDYDGTEHDLQLRRQLQTLVQAGVPTEIRGKLWNMFLKTDSRKVAGLYDKLKEAAQQVADALDSARPAADKLRGGPSTGSLPSLLGPVGPSPHSPTRMPPSNSGASSTSSGAPLVKAVSSGVALLSTVDAGSPRGAPGGVQAQTSGKRRPVSAQVGASSSAKSLTSHVSHSSSTQSLLDNGGCRGGPRPDSAHSRSESDRMYSSVDWHSQIDKDLHRTFPGHMSMNDEGRQSLKNILSAYSVWNPFVGYCQGMNFIAGVLLLFMNEEDAFWCLATIVEERLPGYFSVAMVAPQVDQLVLQALVEEYFPTLTELFKRHGMDVISVSMQWFLCMYINSLPLETALRVWDILFFDASPIILFRVALALLDIYQKSLLATEDSMECMELLAQIPSMSFDGSRLIDVACIAFDSISEEQVYILREQCRERILERVRDLPQHVEMLSARSNDQPSILHQGDPQQIAMQQLFGCDVLPDAYLPRAEAEAEETDSFDPSDKGARLDSKGHEVDMPALVANMRKQILGKMQGRLGRAPPLVLPARGSYWKGVLAEALLDTPAPLPQRGSKDKLSNAQARLNTMLEAAPCQPSPSSSGRFDSPGRSIDDGMPTPDLVRQRQQQDALGGNPGSALSSYDHPGQGHGSPGGPGGGLEASPSRDAWAGRATGPRTPSKAQVAAFEIASNPAIRELAIAQSFIRAERQALDRLASETTSAASSRGGTAGAEPQQGATNTPEPSAATGTWTSSLHRTRSRSLENSLRLTRRMSSRSESGSFFVSTSALATARADRLTEASPELEGLAQGGSALGQASAILKTVLEGLQAEVTTAQERRVASEERREALQQTSALLSGKLDKLLHDLEEKNQTVADLRTKNADVDAELQDLEQQLLVRQEQVYAMTEEKRQRQLELSAKEDVITNLQDQLRKFRQTNGRSAKR